MVTTKSKLNKVPFDPGFAPYVAAFYQSYIILDKEVRKFKNISQRKMKYKSLEPSFIKLCDNVISFYFGGMLYGAYLVNKYKETPCKIDGNDFIGLDEEFCKNSQVTEDVYCLKKFIENNDKSPFSTVKINPKYLTIINAYIEFLEKNHFFINTKLTSDIKIPKPFKYIDKFEEDELDNLYKTIISVINDAKIENILETEYFKKIK